MKNIITNLLASALLLIASSVAFGSTIVGNLLDSGANPAVVTYLRFQPVRPDLTSAYMAYNGSNTIVPYAVRAVVDTNNNFSVFLVGGFYDTYFANDMTLQPLRILVAFGDTNTWTLNQVAQLAVNASMFGLSNVTITNGYFSGTSTNLSGPATNQVNYAAAVAVTNAVNDASNLIAFGNVIPPTANGLPLPFSLNSSVVTNLDNGALQGFWPAGGISLASMVALFNATNLMKSGAYTTVGSLASLNSVGSNQISGPVMGAINASNISGTVSASQLTGTFTALFATNNGARDPLAVAYCNSHGIADVGVLDRLDRFYGKARTMSTFTNMEINFLFDYLYNPQNGTDVFGNTLVWDTSTIAGVAYTAPQAMQYGWGLQVTGTNRAKITIPNPSTNWTIIVNKRNDLAGIRPRPGVSAEWMSEFSLEDYLGNSFNFIWAGDGRSGYQFECTTPGAFGFTNVGYSAVICQLENGTGDCDEAPNALWTFESHNGTNVYGWWDLCQMYSAYGGTTNLVTNPHNYVTNLTMPLVITLGGSTNWIMQSTNNNQGSGDPPTNGCFECFSLAYFNTLVPSNDVAIFYSAEAELNPTKVNWIGIGDSMVADGNNCTGPFDGCGRATNTWLFDLHRRHPYDSWHNWANGGAVIGGLSNNLPPALIQLLPVDQTKIVIEDFMRNDAFITNLLTTLQLQGLQSNLVCALLPWVVPNGQIWQYESPFQSTNQASGVYVTNQLFGLNMRTNLAVAYAQNHTNITLINRFINVESYFSGSVWDTNNGFFGYSTQNGAFMNAGYHIEGTNSAMAEAKIAAFIDTGVWPDTLPATVQMQ